MEKFNFLKGIPVNIPMMNIDTDMIIPKQFLKTIKRTGLGKNLFFEMRYNDDGKIIEELLYGSLFKINSLIFSPFSSYLISKNKLFPSPVLFIVFKNCFGIIISVSILIIGR